MVPIRSLGARHRDRIVKHLLELDEHDRYLRFGYSATDEQISRYADGLILSVTTFMAFSTASWS